MVTFPKAGKAALLKALLDSEIHFEFSSSVAPLTADSTALASRFLRKRVFNKGYASKVMDQPKASIGYTSDAGLTGTGQNQIVAKFTSAVAKSVIYAGNLVSLSPTTSNINAALAAFNPWFSTQKLFPAYGNLDQDDLGLANMLAKFTYLSNARYYSRTIDYDTPISGKVPPVHFSSYHAGKNSLGVDTEPDGTGIESVQSLALKAAANASSSPWKVLAVHYPPVSGRPGWLAELAHLLDGTWDLVLCGHQHVNEEIDISGTVRVLNVSSRVETLASGSLEGAVVNAVKLWSNDTSRCATMIYATEKALVWDVFDIATGAIIRQSHLRKSSAPAVYTDLSSNRYYITAEPTGAVIFNSVVQADDIADATPINQMGIFVGGAAATIANGIENIPINAISAEGTPLVLEDSMGIVHSSAIAHIMTRVVSL